MIDYSPFDKMTFTLDRCFLCGEILNEENQTKEHVYPKWLQNMFNLWDKSIILLNSTDIKYKNLTIPCCKKCNALMSEKIEKPIREGVAGGYEKFVKCDRDTIFLWLNKLSYGLLFKELLIKLDRSNPRSESIFPAEDMKVRKMQFTFLKSITNNTVFHKKPYSILVFHVQNNKSNFWVWENPFTHTFCIQMNDVGVIASLMDNNYNEQFFMEYDKYTDLINKNLHPVQFLEICSRFTYKASLLKKSPFYLTVLDKDSNPSNILSINITGEAYKEWNQEEYAQVFDFLLETNGYKIDKNSVYQGNGQVCTFLYDKEGRFLSMELDNE